MLKSYTYRNKVYSFSDGPLGNSRQNMFTIIVGKNGTGKSRLLSSIVSELVNKKEGKKLFDEHDSPILPVKQRLATRYKPKKVIAISTSPFDRFPISRNYEELEGYSYLGLRDLMSRNFGLAYVSKVMAELLNSISSNKRQLPRISDALGYMGFGPRITISISSRVSHRFLKEVLESKGKFDWFETIRFGTSGAPYLNRKFFLEHDGKLVYERVIKLMSILKRVGEDIINFRFEVQIDDSRITNELEKIRLSEVSFLLQCGILRIRDVRLEKIRSGDSHSISEASSGEQSIVMSILGLASQIKNNSLVCIDEPEICLHPSWQERYIQLLISTFRNFRGCHFLIATHSPQITSNLESSNCFILSMETAQATDAKHLINNSIDFQLANIFNSPGYKNEYLSRIALSIFSKVSRYKKFDSDDLENFDVLDNVSDLLSNTDPVYTLYSAIKKMKKAYE